MDGDISGKKCPAGRYGPNHGLQACTKMCTSGYYCPSGSTYDKVQVCGQGMTGNRYESTYAAKVYCPRGTKTILRASESGDYTTAFDKPGWKADMGPSEDAYLDKRSGLAVCPKNYICFHGARAPALLWKTSIGGTTDSCGPSKGRFKYQKATAITEIPDDVNLNVISNSMEYIDSLGQKFKLTLDDAAQANLAFADSQLKVPEYRISDDIGGINFWEGGQGSEKNGVISMKAGKGINYEAKSGGKQRVLQVTARVSFVSAELAGKYIETRKACKLNVQVRNSNDIPYLYTNQILKIEERSPKDSLLMTPVAAYDPDEVSAGQTFQFAITSIVNADQPSNVITKSSTAPTTPFTIGYCSGILKVTNDILRYHGVNAIRRYRIEILLRDADDNVDSFDNQNDDDSGTSCNSQIGYCQKETTGIVYVEIQNRNDAPVMRSTDNVFNVDEDKPVGASIGFMSFSDEDAEDSHKFRISQIDTHDAIKVESNSGELKVLRKLNFEKKKLYSIKIVVTDSGGWRNIPLSAECMVKIEVVDKNDAPVLPESFTLSIDENSVVGSWVNGYNDLMAKNIGTDEDDINPPSSSSLFKSPLSYECISGECGNDKVFVLKKDGDGWGVQVKKPNLDFELQSTYTMEIRAKDRSALISNMMKLTVDILDVNEPPTLGKKTYSIKEDVSKGHIFGDGITCTTSANSECFDNDADQSHQLFLNNADSDTKDAPFSIDAKTGMMKTTDTLDYETKNQYKMKVLVRDDGKNKLEDEAEWEIDITDVNEIPEITGNQEREVSEDALNNAFVQADIPNTDEIDTVKNADDQLKYSDPDTSNNFAEPFSFRIKSGDPDEIFAIDGSAYISVKDNSNLDYEEKKKYTLLIEIEDSGGKTSSSSVDIHIRDANEAPTLKHKKDAQGDEIDPVERDIDERSNYEEKVGDVIQCDDDDSEDQNSNGDCTGTCQITGHYKKNDGTSATDAYFMFGEDDDGKSTNQLKVKNRCSGNLGCNSATDTNCCEKFEKDSNGEKEYNDCCKIPLQKTVDYVYVKVQCTDTAGKSGTEEYIKVKINEVNEKPDIQKKNFTIYEDFKKGTKVGSKLTAVDQEVSEGSQSLTWSVTKGNSKKIFSIDSGTGQLKIDDATELDFEKLAGDEDEAEIELTIKVEDNDAANPASDSDKIWITVLDVNEKPELDADDFTGEVKENDKKGKKIGDPLRDFDDVDPENKTLTYSIVAGNDDGLFTCEKETGQIKLDVDGILDYETKKEYEVTVRIYEPEAVSSSGYRGNTHVTKGGKVCQSWDKQSPRKHDHTPTKYPSAGLKDTSSCRDPNGRGTVWCYTTEGDKEWDYCTQQLTYDAKLTIEVKDVNEAPTVQMPNEKMSIYEDAGDEDKVGKTMKGEDQDSGDSITYKFEDSTDGQSVFKIHSTSGQISVIDSQLIDYESQKLYKPTVLVTDADGLTGKVKCELHILDVNENPEVGDLDVSIPEDTPIDDVVAKLEVNDPDESDRHTCILISGNNNDAFTVDANDHTVSVRNTSAIDYEAGYTKYTLEIKCSDTQKLSDTATVTIHIYSVPEPPTLEGTTVYINENTAENVLVFESNDLEYNDQDDGGDVSKHKIQIIGGDPGNIFRIEGKNVKVNKRRWSYQKSEKSATWEKPVVISASSDIGNSRIDCPENYKVSFGFAMQQSAREGLNVRSRLVLKRAVHTLEASGKTNKRLNKFQKLTWGDFSVTGLLKNGQFFEPDETTASYAFKAPTHWLKSGKIVLIKNGDKTMGSPDGSLDYYVGLIGSDSSLSQSILIPKKHTNCSYLQCCQ
jgi:hypothetical protein